MNSSQPALPYLLLFLFLIWIKMLKKQKRIMFSNLIIFLVDNYGITSAQTNRLMTTAHIHNCQITGSQNYNKDVFQLGKIYLKL